MVLTMMGGNSGLGLAYGVNTLTSPTAAGALEDHQSSPCQWLSDIIFQLVSDCLWYLTSKQGIKLDPIRLFAMNKDECPTC